MKTNIGMIRKALDDIKYTLKLPLELRGKFETSTRSAICQIDTLLAALSTIDPDANIDALELARKLAVIDESPHARYSDAYFTQAAALITAHDDAIRRECDTSVQDVLTKCGIHLDAGIRKVISAAILGTEPAREGNTSKRQLLECSVCGNLEGAPYELGDGCCMCGGTYIAAITEPAREES